MEPSGTNSTQKRERLTADSEPFSTKKTEGNSTDGKKSEKQGYVIEVDTEELLDKMVKSVAGGVATGFVMNSIMDR